MRTLTACLLLVFTGLQVSPSRGAYSQLGRVIRIRNKGGKFSIQGGMQCTWGAREVSDSVVLTVKCENPRAHVEGGITEITCDYRARPQSCPGFVSDPRAFWKQLGRALKRLQGKVCREERALVKPAMCKRAPREAHFKLDLSSSVASAQSGDPTAFPGTTACSSRAEYCSSSWASVCSFFFSILQGDDC
ncbi:fibroblast growth factor-binding protein 1 [Echeneis naucrates]|uniref:Fibroblast growth factor binding protein 1b n=1 Tax=Echeneis naucrates TaxID=173247 RepID=A0A665TEW8_ECHNA|nr:fibroblast growth factor-binding protein 1 [Echeneis naucrates]